MQISIFSRNVCTFLLSSTVLSIGAFAETSAPSAPAQSQGPGANPSTEALASSTASMTHGGPLDNFVLSLRFEGYGPSIVNGTAYRPNVAKEIVSDPHAEVYSKNKLNVGYKLNSELTTGLGFQFYSLTETGTVFQEPYAYLRDSHLVRAQNFNWDSALKFYGGFTNTSKKYNDMAQVRLAGDAVYKFDSRWSAGLIHELYWYVLSKRSLEARELEFDLWPHVDAQVTQNFTASLILKSFLYHNVGHTFFDQKVDPILISPNATWTFFNKTLAVNPYLDIPVAHLQASLMTVGLNLNWKIL